MEKDQRDLLREFNAHNVRFLIVGGYAFSFYTEPRATKDLDIFMDRSSENAVRVFKALARFGAPLSGMSPKDFEGVDAFFQIGVAPSRIDILQTIEAVNFDAAWQTSEPGMIGDIPVRYISFDDLVKNKLAVGRLRDLADVEALQEARAAAYKKGLRE
jgi:hypothetical protein